MKLLSTAMWRLLLLVGPGLLAACSDPQASKPLAPHDGQGIPVAQDELMIEVRQIQDQPGRWFIEATLTNISHTNLIINSRSAGLEVEGEDAQRLGQWPKPLRPVPSETVAPGKSAHIRWLVRLHEGRVTIGDISEGPWSLAIPGRYAIRAAYPSPGTPPKGEPLWIRSNTIILRTTAGNDPIVPSQP